MWVGVSGRSVSAVFLRLRAGCTCVAGRKSERIQLPLRMLETMVGSRISSEYKRRLLTERTLLDDDEDDDDGICSGNITPNSGPRDRRTTCVTVEHPCLDERSLS